MHFLQFFWTFCPYPSLGMRSLVRGHFSSEGEGIGGRCEVWWALFLDAFFCNLFEHFVPTPTLQIPHPTPTPTPHLHSLGMRSGVRGNFFISLQRLGVGVGVRYGGGLGLFFLGSLEGSEGIGPGGCLHTHTCITDLISHTLLSSRVTKNVIYMDDKSWQLNRAGNWQKDYRISVHTK